MKVAINKDGNSYFIHDAPIDYKFLPVFEISAELYQRWQQNQVEASQIQDELKKIYESSEPLSGEKD